MTDEAFKKLWEDAYKGHGVLAGSNPYQLYDRVTWSREPRVQPIISEDQRRREAQIINEICGPGYISSMPTELPFRAVSPITYTTITVPKQPEPEQPNPELDELEEKFWRRMNGS
jgi:hypothetical protein